MYFEFDNATLALEGLSYQLRVKGSEIGSRLGERVLEHTGVTVTLRNPWDRVITNAARRADLPAQIA